jgi:hypothetical protein
VPAAERCQKYHAQYPKRRKDLDRNQTPQKNTISRCIADKFVSIKPTAVASNAAVYVISEEFA